MEGITCHLVWEVTSPAHAVLDQQGGRCRYDNDAIYDDEPEVLAGGPGGATTGVVRNTYRIHSDSLGRHEDQSKS